MYEKIDRYLLSLIEKSSPENTAWNIEQIRTGKPVTWNYIDGCMLNSLLEMAAIKKDSRYFDFVLRFVDAFVEEDGTIRTFDASKQTLDDINEGRVLFPLYQITGNEKYIKAADLLQSSLAHQPRTEEGSYWHKKIYPHQVWLDGVYMAQVFSALYQKHLGNEDYSDILHQINIVRKHMFDEEKKLYYHGYDCRKTAFWANPTTGCSASFWLRAMGWYASALADLAQILPNGEQQAHIASLLREMLCGIAPYADEATGLYWQVVDRGNCRGNYLETSGSSMIAYAMLKGARLGVLEKEYATKGLKTFHGILNHSLSFQGCDLCLGNICLVAGLGPENNRRRDGSYAYYISEPIVQNDAKGVAPFIMCYTEVCRLPQKE